MLFDINWINQAGASSFYSVTADRSLRLWCIYVTLRQIILFTIYKCLLTIGSHRGFSCCMVLCVQQVGVRSRIGQAICQLVKSVFARYRTHMLVLHTILQLHYSHRIVGPLIAYNPNTSSSDLPRNVSTTYQQQPGYVQLLKSWVFWANL
jgi:hypothetical protein